MSPCGRRGSLNLRSRISSYRCCVERWRPRMPELAIEAKELTRRFGDFVAVNNVSFTVPQGEIFGFLGANGSGKSTTIRMLCGLLQSSSGTASVAGFDINSQPEEIKRRIGYMSQKFS